IIKYAEDILEYDYSHNHINYLFRMYELVPGFIFGDSSSGGYWYTEAKEFDSTVGDRSYSEWYNRHVAIKDILVPVYNNKRPTMFFGALMREAENMYRKSVGLYEVGDGWVSETLLFKQIEAAFPDLEVLQHYSPSFLGRQHYDIYIPKYMIALEYQGDQHFRPIDFFGGEKAFLQNQKRDEKKRKLSEKHGVKLIEVLPDYSIKDIINTVTDHMGDELGVEQKQKAVDLAMNLPDDSLSLSMEKVIQSFTKGLAEQQRKQKEKEEKDAELSALIQDLIAQKTPSPYSDHDWLYHNNADLHQEIAKKLEKINACDDLEKAYEKCMKLTEKYPRVPDAYINTALLLKKMGRLEEALDMYIQVRCDFGVEYQDPEIKKIIRAIRRAEAKSERNPLED
nr:hypothetical protein [Lachnospiraceae bacterium]